MARGQTIKVLRAARAALDSQAGASGLIAGEPYLITDEGRLAVGTAADAYVAAAREDHHHLPLYTPAVAAGALVLDLNGQRESVHRVTLDGNIAASGITVTDLPSGGVIRVLVELRQSGGPHTCPVEAWSGISGLVFDTQYQLYTDTTPTTVTLLSTDGGTSWRARCNAPITLADLADFASGAATDGYVATADGAGGVAWEAPSGGVSDGDKGDIIVSSSGATWTIDNGAVTLAKQADMATSSVVYRKTAGTGAPEVQSLATLKTDLGLTGTNSGDQSAQAIATAIDADATAETTLKSALGLGTAAYTASTAYAPAAQGVTNGDAHDHSGGDGGQIAYASLSGAPTIPSPSSASPQALGTAAAGSSADFSRADHVHDLPALDALDAPSDVTTLNVSTGAHGLAPKLSGVSTQYLNGVGSWTTPEGGSGGVDSGLVLIEASSIGGAMTATFTENTSF